MFEFFNSKKEKMLTALEEGFQNLSFEGKVSTNKISKADEKLEYKVEDIEELLKSDFIENSEIYFLSWRQQIRFINHNHNLLRSYNIVVDEVDIYNTFLELYRLSLEAEDLSQFKGILSKERTRIIKQKLGFIPQKSREYCFSADELLAFQCNERCELYNDLITTDTWLDLQEERVKDIINAQMFDSEITRNHLICCMLGSIEALVISIVIYREKQKIVNNNEFYCLMKNVLSEFNLCDAQEKIYEMYTNFYSNVLEKYSKSDFEILVTMMYDSMMNDSEMLISPDREEMQLEIKEDLVDYEDIYELTCNIVENVKYEYGRSSLERLYLLNLGDKVLTSSVSSVFSTLLKVINIGDDIEEYLKRKRLESDKQRYIVGDFTKERSIEKESIRLSNVSTGLEFENYLKNLFKKLGYNVEMTKASGDQGADLIISKEGVKTAVQAKFYSSKVGNKAVQEVVSAIKYYNVDYGMVVTNNYYTSSAIDLAYANNITLIDGDNLKELIDKIICESDDVSNEASNSSEFSIEKFLSQLFTVGNCLYKNKFTGEFDAIQLTLLGGYLIIKNIEEGFSEQNEQVLIYPVECNLISSANDISLISVGEEWFGMSETQYQLLESYVKLLNTIIE